MNHVCIETKARKEVKAATVALLPIVRRVNNYVYP